MRHPAPESAYANAANDMDSPNDLTYPVTSASTDRATVEPTLKRQCATLRLDPDVFSASSSRIA
jgi:hypothetical protein